MGDFDNLNLKIWHVGVGGSSPRFRAITENSGALAAILLRSYLWSNSEITGRLKIMKKIVLTQE
mgnify:CR=1 FL=1